MFLNRTQIREFRSRSAQTRLTRSKVGDLGLLPRKPPLLTTLSSVVFEEWIDGWRRKDWKTSNGKPVVNRDLIEYILALIADRMPPNSYKKTANVTFIKVKAHAGIEGNEMADTLAKNGASLPAIKEFDYAGKTKEVKARLAKKGLPKVTESIQFEVDIGEDDLLTDEELREMGENQSFD